MSKSKVKESADTGWFYFFGFVGALVYYISEAENISDGFVGFLKAIVWPAFLVYKAMQSLNM